MPTRKLVKREVLTMVVYLVAQDSHGDPCVVPVSAHYHLHITNTGIGPYDVYPTQETLSRIQASGIPLPLQSELEQTAMMSDRHTAADKFHQIMRR